MKKAFAMFLSIATIMSFATPAFARGHGKGHHSEGRHANKQIVQTETINENECPCFVCQNYDHRHLYENADCYKALLEEGTCLRENCPYGCDFETCTHYPRLRSNDWDLGDLSEGDVLSTPVCPIEGCQLPHYGRRNMQ